MGTTRQCTKLAQVIDPLSSLQAADFMQKQVQRAYNKWTTGFYDYVQYLQNAIPK